MTKEELESKFEDCFDANTRESEGGYGPDVTDRLGVWWSFSPVISEYAKAFADWIRTEKWNNRNGHDWCRYESIYSDIDIKTTEELYTQFIEQQTKDK